MSGFEWDETKRLMNRAERGFDFDDLTRLFDAPWYEQIVQRGDETRVLATAFYEGRWVTIVFTWRNDRRRFISARSARGNERYGYRNLHR